MAQLIVRNLEDDIKARLVDRARRHGRSMEDEVRDILRSAVARDIASDEKAGLGTRIAALFEGIGLREGEEIEEFKGQDIWAPDFGSHE